MNRGARKPPAGLKRFLLRVKSHPHFARFRKPRSYAYGELDLKLSKFLDTRDGFFVEAGANDGFSQSNTLFFERHRGWRGILVEAIPDLADYCRVIRPTAHVVQAALVPYDYAEPTIPMRYCDLMSTVKGAMRSAEEENQHIALGAEVQDLTAFELTVPAVPLGEILDRRQVTDFDLLSLDVEGFEASALRGLDLRRHRPRYMLVECRYREQVEEVLGDVYRSVAELSHHDVLFERNQVGTARAGA